MNTRAANFLGILSLLFWSMNVALTRHIGEGHVFGMPGVSFILSGALLLVFDALRGATPPWRSTASPKFWTLGGGAFVTYLVLYASGLSWSDSRDVVLPLGLINYFWPSLILALMPFFFHTRVRWPILAAGIGLCVVGVGLSMLWGQSVAAMSTVLLHNWPAVIMMAIAGFLWAFYSNAVRKWGGNANGVGWFLVTGGVCCLGLWAATGEPLGFTREMLLPLILHAVLVNATAYMLWDCGVRWGNIGMMGILANFLPIGSVLFGVWYLANSTTPGLWIGSALVTAGAVVCRWGMTDTAPRT